jgi:hypothetical protein
MPTALSAVTAKRAVRAAAVSRGRLPVTLLVDLCLFVLLLFSTVFPTLAATLINECSKETAEY